MAGEGMGEVVPGARPRSRSARRSVSGPLAALAALVVGACAVDTSAPVAAFDASATPPAERPLVIVADLEPMRSLDPARATCDPCRMYLAATYETLLAAAPPEGGSAGEDGLVGRLARSWSSDEELTTFTFELDPEATFADGTAVEAGDVVWSWERALAAGGHAASLLDGLAEVHASGPRTVVVRFARPNADLPAIATSPNLGVVNRDAVQGSGEAAVDLDVASAGSGAFLLEAFTPGEELRLARDEDHWRGRADVASAVVWHLSSDRARGNELASGRADLALALRADVVGDLDLDLVAELVAVEAPSDGLVYLALSPGAANGAELTAPVRRAISLALDRDRLVDVAADGAATTPGSPIPVDAPGGAAVAPPERDVAAARQLLEEAGLGEGFSLEAAYPAVTAYGVDLATVAEQVADDLADVGIELALEAVAPAAWAERLAGPGIAVTLGYAGADHPGSSQFVRLFGLVPGSLWGERAGGGRPLVDAAQAELAAAALATDDPAEQAEHYGALAEAMAEDDVIIPLLSPEVYLAHRSDLTGVEPSTCFVVELASLSMGPS
ncbi:MAG: hypothetical protein GEV08_24555 [Acidimicrobiia bacterium]|nr:hypothetical protein [Acidimicrobiia bacterium]